MEIVKFYNPGAIIDRLPKSTFKKLQEVIKEKRLSTKTFDTQAKRNLQILSIKEINETPYVKELDEFIHQMYLNWCAAFDVIPVKIGINPVWTNYMRKSEYIPVHNHEDSYLSFVIWIRIPYDKKNEETYHFEHADLHPTIDGKENNNGMFKFMYSMFSGSVCTHIIELDEKMEGSILLFPGNMYHLAYPFFTSDEERIAIAGNINRIP